jgi:hypothetical protein
MELARDFSIPFVRVSRNVGPAPIAAKRLYKVLMNNRLRVNGLSGAPHFGSAEDYASDQRRLAGCREVMVHPEIDKGQLVDVTLSDPVALDKVIATLGIAGCMLSYADYARAIARS